MDSIKNLTKSYTDGLRRMLHFNPYTRIRPVTGKKSRYFIDNEFLKDDYVNIHRYALNVYSVLSMHANHKSQTCFPSIKTITRESSVKNRNTVLKVIKILESYNIISVTRSSGRKPNIYTLIDSKLWIKRDGIPKLTHKTVSCGSVNDIKKSNIQYHG